jgi:EmrB/QacA subfamily drug resistance transporter
MTSSVAAASSDLSRRDIVSIMSGLMLAQFMGALDQTIVAPAMPTLGRLLGDLENLPWIVTSYLLVSTAVTPLYGKLSDIHGRRPILLIAIVIFVVGSIACALSTNMLALVLARGLQGLGGGGLIALTQAIVGDIIPPKQRPQYQVYIQTTWLAAGLGGPVIGGFFSEYLHWSMIFWINLPLGLAAYLMTDRKLRRLPGHGRPHDLDIAGSVLMIGMSVSLMLALSWGGTRYAWDSSAILGLLGASAVLLAGLVLRLRHAREPLIPISVLSNQIVFNGTVSVCFSMSVLIGLIIFLPIYFEIVLGFDADAAGMALVPLVVGTTIGAGIASRVMGRSPRYKRPGMIGLAISIVAALLLFAFARKMNLIVLEIVLASLSMGLGAMLPVTTTALQNAVPRHEMGTTMALLNFLRQLGSAFAVACFGSILISLSGATRGSAHEILLRVGAQNTDGLARGFTWLFLLTAVSLALSFLFLGRMEEKELRDTPHAKT